MKKRTLDMRLQQFNLNKLSETVWTIGKSNSGISLTIHNGNANVCMCNHNMRWFYEKYIKL